MRKRLSVLSAGLVALALAASAASGHTATKSSTLPTLPLTMTGKAITAPSTVAAGAVDVVSTVNGEAAGSPTLVKLASGVTFPQAFANVSAHGGDPNALQGYASAIFNVEAPRGTSDAQTVLTPGNWVALDTTSSNPVKWPVAQFTVTANPSPASLPVPGATVRMEEFKFGGASTLHDGELVRFENDGYLVHMTIAVPVKSRASGKAVDALLLAGRDRKAQKLVTGAPYAFVGTGSPGLLQQQVITLKPGWYVFACFMDTQDGREHTRLGMERVVHITR